MATKKITELPFINTLSGSSVFDNPTQNTVVPVVLYGTTNQITVENFSKFTNLYAAQTGSQNIFTDNQWFNATESASTINVGTLGVGGNTTIAGTLGVTGNGTIGGDLVVNGKLTAQEVYTEITSASIIFESGSTKFGDDTGDKHQFTGSINVSGSVIYNGVILSNIDANTIQRLQQATQSLQVATASLQAFSSSVNDQLQRVYQTTQSLHVATASLQFHSASVDSQLLAIQQTTQSLQVATASLNTFTASQDSRNYVISQFTSSTDAHIVGISAFTSSQLAVNLGNAIYTASVDSHIVGISTYTSSVRDTLARVHQSTQSLQVATASLQQFTASQDDRNFVVSQVTGSLIGITNGLMAFTAALDNTYATDAQLYQLYQATRSLELHSGSMVGVTNGLMAYTASNTSLNSGLRGEVDGIEAYTASLKGQAIVSSSTQIQNYDLFALNSNVYNGTGSIKAEVAGIEAYTASLKNSTIVSSSTQIFTGYDYEIHVSQVDGNDTTGNGDLLTPVATITKALTLVTGQRRTVIIHPGSYTESPSITSQYTVLTTFEPLGGNTAIVGTVSTSVGCTITGLTIQNLTITAGTGVGVPNIINCNISGTLTKSGNATFTDIHNCDIGTACNITGTGLVTINDGNPNFVTVNNAGANVIIKGAMSCVSPSVTSGTLSITDSIVIAAVTNAVTSNASSVVTLANCQLLTSALNAVAPVSLSGFYSIFNCVFDKPNSTLVTLSGTGGSTNSIDYFQYINADKFITQGGTGYQFLKGDGSLDSIMPASLQQTTASLNLTTGSLIGITNGLMAFTAALDSTYATDAQLYQLYAETASIKAEIAGIEAYTASLKGAFTIDGNNDVYFTGKITTQEVHTTYTTSSVLFQSGSTKLGNSFDDKHEITGSLNTSFGGRGGLFVNDGFQKTFTFPTGNLFSIDFGSAEGGGFVDVTYGGVVTSIGGRGGATRYAIAYKNATDAVATKVHGYGDDIVSASISATKVAIFSIGGDAVQSAKYQLNVSVNAVAADGAGDYDVIQYKRL
jgi:hypothetical protein